MWKIGTVQIFFIIIIVIIIVNIIIIIIIMKVSVAKEAADRNLGQGPFCL